MNRTDKPQIRQSTQNLPHIFQLIPLHIDLVSGIAVAYEFRTEALRAEAATNFKYKLCAAFSAFLVVRNHMQALRGAKKSHPPRTPFYPESTLPTPWYQYPYHPDTQEVK
jgi:hypothetical protein